MRFQNIFILHNKFRLFLILLALMLFLSSCSGKTNRNSSFSSSAVNESSIGENVIVGKWKITLNTIGSENTIESDLGVLEAKEGNTWAVIDLKIKNLHTSPQKFLWYIADHEKNTSDIDAFLMYKGKYSYYSENNLKNSVDLHLTSLNPLDERTGKLAFKINSKIANDLKNLQLVFISANEKAIFKLTE